MTEMILVFRFPEYTSETTIRYLNFFQNTDALVLDKKTLTQIAKLTTKGLWSNHTKIDSIARIQFYSVKSKKGDSNREVEWYGAISCEEYFSDIWDSTEFS